MLDKPKSKKQQRKIAKQQKKFLREQRKEQEKRAPNYETTIAMSRMATKEKKVFDRRDVFTLPKHPPTVMEAVNAKKLAMDEAPASTITISLGWAGSALAGVNTEGLTFLGYPYLAELTQRPEYRYMSEIPAEEMTREWIEFYSVANEDKTEEIKELEAEFKRLNVPDIFRRAKIQDGFFGRGHIYIDTGDTDDPQELMASLGTGWDDASKSKISKDHPIVALRTVEAVWCYPTSYDSNNPLKDDWYRPNMWFVQQNIVHSSRLITFIGNEVPDLLKPTYSFGGISMSQLAKPYVDNWLQTRQGVNDIVNSFSIFALGCNMQEAIQTDGRQPFQRALLFNTIRSNQGLMVYDKDTEEFQNVAAPLNGLDQLQAQAQEHQCFVSRTPKIKLFGYDPAGLNASNDNEVRCYYDTIHGDQERDFRKPIHRLLGLIMLSIWGKTDEDISFKFKPLWALDEKGQAEVEKTKAETDNILIDAGVIAPEESRVRVASDTDSDYSTIDVENVPDLLEEEEAGLEPTKGGGGEGAADPQEGATAAKPRVAKRDSDEGAKLSQRGAKGAQQAADGFNESEHPRNEDGEFSKSGSGGNQSPKLTPKEKAYLSSFSGDRFLELNKNLRNGNDKDLDVKNIDKAIEKLIVPTTSLYRGISKNDLKSLIQGDTVNKGSIISDKAFVSTSTDENVARNRAIGGVLLKIETGKDQHGLDMSKISSNPTEKEVLLPRNTKMRITKISAPKSIGAPIILHLTTEVDEESAKLD